VQRNPPVAAIAAQYALMSFVKRFRHGVPHRRFPPDSAEAMIVQGWGRSLETSVIKL
jgi:hypothetical protein